MNLLTGHFGGLFGSGNELDAFFRTGRFHPLTPLDTIVISEGHCIQALCSRVRCQFFWRVGPIGEMGVKVEVGEFHWGGLD